MRLRVTSWNANSVRLREDCLTRITAEVAPDVLCLQEIKVSDELFPHGMFERLGYAHRHVFGQKAYHGVAILSKLPLFDRRAKEWCGVDHRRHAWVTLPGGVELHNFYIPAGGAEPDPEINPKFKHKLGMLADLADWFEDRRDDSRRVIVVGDLNVAPLEHDVWSHKQLLNVVSHTPVEVEALGAWQERAGLFDAHRHFVSASEKLYSWWSYRNQDWAKSNRGRRLDHAWLSPALKDGLRSATILREARGWPAPSDHAPVTVEVEI